MQHNGNTIIQSVSPQLDSVWIVENGCLNNLDHYPMKIIGLLILQ